MLNFALVGSSGSVYVMKIRWAAFGDVYGEGLIAMPSPTQLNRKIALVIAIPDSTQTPEQLVGLAPGIVPEQQFARRLAESGCWVVIPTIVDRSITPHKISNREFLYRSAFELGRHLIGYEIQKVSAGIDWLARDDPNTLGVGVIGWGDGGMIAMEAAALDPRIQVACVSGYFGDRKATWSEPIDRNVFGMVERFGDAEIAAMIAPRTLIVEASMAPEVEVPRGTNGGPGKLVTPRLDVVKAEFGRAKADDGGARSRGWN